MIKSLWIINHYAITPEYAGGTRHYELALHLSKMGYKVAVFASSVLHQNSSVNILKKKQKYEIVDINDNFKFVWFKTLTYTGNGIRRIFNMFSFISIVLLNYRKLIKSNIIQIPDIIVGSTVPPFVPLLAKYIAKKLKAKYIFEIRDLWPKSFIDLGVWEPNSIISKLFYSIEKCSTINTDSIISLSPLTKQYLKDKYKVSESKIFYIPNGTSLENSEKSRSESVKQIKSTNKFNVIFTGSIILSNKVELICETAKIVLGYDDIFFHIIGDGQNKEFLINKYGYLTNIKWYNSVPKNEIPLILNAADVLLLIQGNVAWGSSNKLYDYLAAGKPIISSVWVTHNDIVKKIHAGISIEAENPKLLKDALLHIKQLSQNDRNIMGKNAINYINQNHNWDILAKKFEKAILGEK